MASSLASPVALVTGMRMDRGEFIRRWELLPELKNAELIDGVVYVASPLSLRHGTIDSAVITLLGNYTARTPGCDSGNNNTWFMGESAPQPDAWLRILPAAGGQSGEEGIYGAGAPEFAVEVCETSAAVDLGPKLALYQRSGVLEYVTIETRQRRITWRVLRDGRYDGLTADASGVYRSTVFPGLWLDAEALWAGDRTRLVETLDAGLASTEHRAFAGKLRAAASGD